MSAKRAFSSGEIKNTSAVVATVGAGKDKPSNFGGDIATRWNELERVFKRVYFWHPLNQRAYSVGLKQPCEVLE